MFPSFWHSGLLKMRSVKVFARDNNNNNNKSGVFNSLIDINLLFGGFPKNVRFASSLGYW